METITEQTANQVLTFEILAPTNGEFSHPIIFNYEQISNYIDKVIINKYADIVYSEDKYLEAKKDKSDLNKFKKLINDEKIRVHKEIEKYYKTDFEPKVKDILSKIDGPIKSIDGFLDIYTQKQRENKRNSLKTHFEENIDDSTRDYLTYERIEVQEWLNASFSINKAFKLIDEVIENTKKDIETLATFTDHTELLKKKYKETLNLGEVLREKARLDILKAEFEREKEASLNQARQSEVSKEQDTCTFKPISDEEASKYMTMAVNSQTPAVKPYYYKKSFEIRATADDLRDLDSFLKSRNIQYRII